MNACSDADIDNEISRAHSILVMLYHDNAVAKVAQTLQRCYQLVIVALMQTDRRLVKDIQHPDKRRAYLCCEPYALALAARERTA